MVRRWGRRLPDDIGKPVVFFLSSDADFITGQTLYVDGGTNARMGFLAGRLERLRK